MAKKEGSMRKIILVITVISLFCLFITADSFAQRGMMWKGSGGWERGAKYEGMYDPKTVGTITGEVVKIERFVPIRGMSRGVHVLVKTEKEEISVHLGPAWYIENQDVKIEPKDKIEVKGSRITFQGKAAIIAAEVKKGDNVLKLRDENGFPVWMGWRRR